MFIDASKTCLSPNICHTSIHDSVIEDINYKVDQRIVSRFPSSIPILSQIFGLVVSLVILVRGLNFFWGFVQDDAFISLRYAQNLLLGRGLVFNPDEKVEGFTNLGWTLLGTFFEMVDIDAIVAWKVLGSIAAVLLVILGYVVGRSIHRELGGIGVALLIASSPILQCWSVSALEQTPVAVLILASAWAFGRGRINLCYALLGVAQLLRPDAALGVPITLYLVWVYEVNQHGIRWRSAWRSLRGLWVYLIFSVPVLLFRISYYGEWVPNTYLVKGGGSWQNHQLGLVRIYQLADKAGTFWIWLALCFLIAPCITKSLPNRSVKEHLIVFFRRWSWLIILSLFFLVIQLYLLDGGYLSFGWNVFKAASRHSHAWYILVLLSLLGAFALRAFVFPPASIRQNRCLAWAGIFWLCYFYYYIRIGGDSMTLDRLFLTAMPLQALLAVAGVVRLAGTIPTVVMISKRFSPSISSAEVRGAIFMLAVVWIVGPSFSGIHYAGKRLEMLGVLSAIKNCHGRISRVLQSTAEKYHFSPLVLAQDMGYLTIKAPDVRFFDTIGIVTRSVADILHEYHYNPYFRYLVWRSPKERKRIKEMELKLKNMYSNQVKPDYVVTNVDVPTNKPKLQYLANQQLDRKSEWYWRVMSGRNDFFYRWPQTDDFKQNYRLVEVIDYNTVSYLVLWRREGSPALVDIHLLTKKKAVK